MSEPATSVQPSTSTKKMSLNGSDTTTGGSIIMPIDISTRGDDEIDDEEGKKQQEADLRSERA